MNSVIIINKNGDLSDLSVKKIDVDTLYKRAGFKQATGFELKLSWTQTVQGVACSIKVFGKTTGREPQKNAFKFGGDTVFFGNILLVGMDGENSVVNIKRGDIDIDMIPGFVKEFSPAKELSAAVLHIFTNPPSTSVIPAKRGNSFRAKAVIEPKNYFDCSSELTEVAYI